MEENITKVLGIQSKKRGYNELSNGDVVTWAMDIGSNLKKPDAYPEYKEWNWESLPVIPPVMETEVGEKKLEQLQIHQLLALLDCLILIL